MQPREQGEGPGSRSVQRARTFVLTTKYSTPSDSPSGEQNFQQLHELDPRTSRSGRRMVKNVNSSLAEGPQPGQATINPKRSVVTEGIRGVTCEV